MCTKICEENELCIHRIWPIFSQLTSLKSQSKEPSYGLSSLLIMILKTTKEKVYPVCGSLPLFLLGCSADSSKTYPLRSTVVNKGAPCEYSLP